MTSATNDLDTTIARGAIGAALYVMAAGHPTILGIMKEGLAIKRGVKDVPAGPARDLIKRAGKISLGSDVQNDLSATIEAGWEPERFESEGGSALDAAVVALATLPPDEADQVKHWYVSIGERVAEATADKGSKEKVTQVERDQIERLRSILGIA